MSEPPGNSVDTPVLYCSCLETGPGSRACLLGDTANFLVSTEYIQDEAGVSWSNWKKGSTQKQVKGATEMDTWTNLKDLSVAKPATIWMVKSMLGYI